jgi:hypothetical protein
VRADIAERLQPLAGLGGDLGRRRTAPAAARSARRAPFGLRPLVGEWPAAVMLKIVEPRAAP